MKKAISLILLLVLTMSIFSFAFSANAAELTANVYVSISASKDTLNMAYDSVAVTDKDGDGVLTINDALYCAHEQYFEGGAAKGYQSKSVSGYNGLSLLKLWGKSGGFAYYLNNAKAWSLSDAVKSGDHVYAFVYSDNMTWSDKYSYFDPDSVTIEPNKEITVTLNYFNKLTSSPSPLKGAVITVDGVETDLKTDAEGKAVIDGLSVGKHIISVKSPSGVIITPPVCQVTIKHSFTTWLYSVLNRIISAVKSLLGIL